MWVFKHERQCLLWGVWVARAFSACGALCVLTAGFGGSGGVVEAFDAHVGLLSCATGLLATKWLRGCASEVFMEGRAEIAGEGARWLERNAGVLMVARGHRPCGACLVGSAHRIYVYE